MYMSSKLAFFGEEQIRSICDLFGFITIAFGRYWYRS